MSRSQVECPIEVKVLFYSVETGFAKTSLCIDEVLAESLKGDLMSNGERLRGSRYWRAIHTIETFIAKEIAHLPRWREIPVKSDYHMSRWDDSHILDIDLIQRVGKESGSTTEKKSIL